MHLPFPYYRPNKRILQYQILPLEMEKNFWYANKNHTGGTIMDAQKKIRTYICPKPWLRWIALALLAAAAVLLIGGIIAFAATDNTVTPFSREDSQPGAMASLEITGVSHWLYRTSAGTYYTAADATGNNYILCLTTREFANLSQQAAYYLFQTGDTPDPYPLTGCVQVVPAEVRDGLAQVWDLTAEEFDSEFGTLVLNCATTARREAASPWFSPALICGLVGLALLFYWRRREQTALSCLARLEELGLVDNAASQLTDLDRCTLLGDDQGKLTEDFLFGRETGMACALQDIAWFYRTEKSRLFLLPRTVLMAGTRHTGLRPAVNLKRFDRLNISADVAAAIARRNSNLLLNKSRENSAAFKKLCK